MPDATSNAAVLRQDADRVMALKGLSAPNDTALVEAARLLMRYPPRGFGSELHQQLLVLLGRWNLSRDQLHARTRELWSQGWRPPVDPTHQLDGVVVGSGADVSS